MSGYVSYSSYAALAEAFTKLPPMSGKTQLANLMLRCLGGYNEKPTYVMSPEMARILRNLLCDSN